MLHLDTQDQRIAIATGIGARLGAISRAPLGALCLQPGIPVTPAPFVIVGMMALFGGIAHAPHTNTRGNVVQ